MEIKIKEGSNMQSHLTTYKGYRFPREIIGHAVWIYDRFNASLKDTSQALSYRSLDINGTNLRLDFIF